MKLCLSRRKLNVGYYYHYHSYRHHEEPTVLFLEAERNRTEKKSHLFMFLFYYKGLTSVQNRKPGKHVIKTNQVTRIIQFHQLEIASFDIW